MVLGRRQNFTIDGRHMVQLARLNAAEDGVSLSHGDVEFAFEHPDHANSIRTHDLMIEFLRNDGGVGMTVLELFGGPGWLTSQIQASIKPAHHEVWDISPWGAVTIQANAPGAVVRIRDSYLDPIPEGIDWIECDYDNFTLRQIAGLGRGRTLFDRTFRKAVRYVSLAESALYGTKRWRKNIDAYERMFGAELVDWKAYYDLMSDIVHEAYGFGLVQIIIKKGYRCAHLLFKRGAVPLGSKAIILCREGATIVMGTLDENVEVSLLPERSDPAWSFE